MAAPAPVPPSTSSSDSDSDTESSTTNYGSIADEAAHVIYRDGQLSWSEGRYAIKDEDIITVTKVEGSNIAHTIWGLAPVEVPTESSPKQPPFELRSTSATNLPQVFLDKYLFQALPAQLDPASNELHILVSTLSGTGLAPPFYDNVLRIILDTIGLKESDYNVIRTSSAESVAEFAYSTLLPAANRGKHQTVLTLSGDGALVDIINGLLDSEERSKTYVRPTVNQLPLGTGNALFHSLHRPSPLLSIYIQGLRTLLHGIAKPLPIFRAKFSPGARYLSNEGRTATPLVHDTLYGAVVASYGLHATLVADSDTTEYRKHGAARFGLVAKDLLFPPEGALPHAYKADVTLYKDSGEVKLGTGEHGYILASLVSNLEKPFTISPEGKPLDGQLRIVQFGALSGEQMMNVMKEAYNNGNHITLDEVLYESISGLKIQFHEIGESSKWRRVCIDGLIVSVEEGGWVEVRTVESGTEAVNIVVDP